MTAFARAAQPEIARQAASEARAAARPLVLAWLKNVEAKVRTKKLRDLDYRLAVILTNYPSANVGKCWAGQKRLSDQAGRCERTTREALGRLESEGLLKTRRGGQGRTSCYTFTVDGCEVFGRQRDAGLDRQQAAAKPSELKPTEQEDSPPTPTHRADLIDLAAERRTRRSAITGYEFLAKCRRVESCKDGPALAEWNRLSRADQQAIWRIIEHDGNLDVAFFDVWVCTFLKNRMWDGLGERDLPKQAKEKIDQHLAAMQSPKSAAEPADRVFVSEDTPQWAAWTRHYREHGAPNGTRVGPASFSYHGIQGNFFASDWPPQ
jgi:DNA-binding PadR family transcriptional regulator